MPVITQDATVAGIKREAVFEWLGQPMNHERFLQRVFPLVERRAEGVWSIDLGVPGVREPLGYELAGSDRSHGGRRILVKTTGRRTRGRLHYSLATARPSTNTMVTLHLDYDPGSVLGVLIDASVLRRRLEVACSIILEHLVREVGSDLAPSEHAPS